MLLNIKGGHLFILRILMSYFTILCYIDAYLKMHIYYKLSKDLKSLTLNMCLGIQLSQV